MAPEHPPRLAIWDTRWEDKKFLESVEYVEVSDSSKTLRVRWAVEDQPPVFIAVGGGVAYVYDAEHVSTVSISKNQEPDSLSHNRYRIIEGMPPNDEWLMLILIVPPGFVITDASPAPVSAKEYQGRLALYWILEGDRLNRTQAEWTISKAKNTLRKSAEELNRNYEPEVPTNLEHSMEDLSNNVFFIRLLQSIQMGGVKINAEGDVNIGGNVIGGSQRNSPNK